MTHAQQERKPFATLTHGDPIDVANLLDNLQVDEPMTRAVLINLLNRVAQLEQRVWGSHANR